MEKPKDAKSKTLLNDERFGDILARNFSCKITDQEALYAIARAKTEVCKEELADIVCQDKAGKLMPDTIPRYCPLRGTYTYITQLMPHLKHILLCFNDN